MAFEPVLTKGIGQLDLVDIEEIQYQGVLVEIPATAALDLLEQSGDLPNLKEVMTIRPPASRYRERRPRRRGARTCSRAGSPRT